MMEKILHALHLRCYDPVAKKHRLDRVEELQTLTQEIREGTTPLRVIRANDDSLDFMRRHRSGRG